MKAGLKWKYGHSDEDVSLKQPNGNHFIKAHTPNLDRLFLILLTLKYLIMSNK